MKTVYYRFLPESYQRPGGVWWAQHMPEQEVEAFCRDLRDLPATLGIAVGPFKADLDRLHIAPPEDAEIVRNL